MSASILLYYNTNPNEVGNLTTSHIKKPKTTHIDIFNLVNSKALIIVKLLSPEISKIIY